MVENRAGKEKGRAERLASALRDNLKRRKAQARAKTADPADPSTPASQAVENAAPIASKTPKKR